MVCHSIDNDRGCQYVREWWIQGCLWRRCPSQTVEAQRVFGHRGSWTGCFREPRSCYGSSPSRTVDTELGICGWSAASWARYDEREAWSRHLRVWDTSCPAEGSMARWCKFCINTEYTLLDTTSSSPDRGQLQKIRMWLPKDRKLQIGGWIIPLDQISTYSPTGGAR